MFPNKCDSKKTEKINRKLVMMIARDFQPLSIVEDKGFIDFVHESNPGYKIISRKVLTTKLLPKLFGVSVRELKNLLSKSNYMSVTCDAWTSTARDSYLGITCHFLEENVEEGRYALVSAALDTIKLKKDETAESLKRILESVFKQWGILGKVQCLVTDNAPNMKKTADLLQIKHLPCFAHSLNLVIKNAVLCKKKNKFVNNKTEVAFEVEGDENNGEVLLDSTSEDTIQRLIGQCKETVTFFHSSPKATQMLRDLRARARTDDGEVASELVQQVSKSYYS